MPDINEIFHPDEVKFDPFDDHWLRAWKAGFVHSYFGIDSGWLGEDYDLYEEGVRDGTVARQQSIQDGWKDPHQW